MSDVSHVPPFLDLASMRANVGQIVAGGRADSAENLHGDLELSAPSDSLQGIPAVSPAGEEGVDCAVVPVQAEQTVFKEADQMVDSVLTEASSQVDQLRCALAAEKTKVAEQEDVILHLTTRAKQASQEAKEVQQQFAASANSVLASGTQFLASLRALLKQPTQAPGTQEPQSQAEDSGDTAKLPQLCQPCNSHVNAAQQEDIAAGPLLSSSLVEGIVVGHGKTSDELAASRVRDLEDDEHTHLQRLISRLIEEKRNKEGERTLWSITKKLIGMPQRDLDHLVDVYDAGLCSRPPSCAADVGSHSADAAAGDTGGSHSAAGSCSSPADRVPPPSPVNEDASSDAIAAPVTDHAVESDPVLPVDEEPEEPPTDSVAVYCEVCVIWLNGPKQYESHSIGRKHRKRERDKSRGKAEPLPAPTTDAPVDCSSMGMVFQ